MKVIKFNTEDLKNLLEKTKASNSKTISFVRLSDRLKIINVYDDYANNIGNIKAVVLMSVPKKPNKFITHFKSLWKTTK